MQYEPEQINNFSYKIEKKDDMNVPVKIFANQVILEEMKQDRCIDQAINVSKLPGIVGESIMMPDAHQGYGFSVGGVAAMDTENGCISPGGVGFDINCGVRLLVTDLDAEKVRSKIQDVLDTIFENVPAGVGGKSPLKLSIKELEELLQRGPEYLVEKGYGNETDVERCESEGKMKDANHKRVSKKAKQRGKNQVGTLGGGNHFLEIQRVGEIFDLDKAETFGIENENQAVILIHTGSRGLGHQVCSDYLRKVENTYPEIMESLPEKNLAYAPAGSKLANHYYEAMCASANYAWSNRHMIGHQVRQAMKDVFGKDVTVETVYDVAHNIAKKETHDIDGEKKEVWIHRKGATRAFGPGNPEIPAKYQETGQPVFIPGSMGTSSYVLAGAEESMKQSYGSTAHGSGRLMSRTQARNQWTSQGIKKELEKDNIIVKAASNKGVTEEAPGAYKNVDEVVKVSDEAGIATLVAQLKPMGVVKG